MSPASLLTPEQPALLLYDLDAFDARIASLKRAFPPGTLHALAVKACPLLPLLRRALDQGLGLEVASMGELALARHLQALPDAVLMDAPCKSEPDLVAVFEAGVRLNVDNPQELDRVARRMEGPGPRPASVGLRLNPGLQGGDIPETFTGAAGAKFGFPLPALRDQVFHAFDRHPWLDGLHVHTGSQGCGLRVLVAGVAALVEVAQALQARGRPPALLDIGGGLPVAYRPGESAPSFEDYARALRREVPELFAGPWRVATEFGRALLAPCAVAASRVEAVRPGRVAVVHLGADLLLRAAYRPEQWFHRVQVLDPQGRPKQGAPQPWTVAGPLCFAGDLVARDRPLPPIEAGDVVLIHDVGAYTLSMWSRYNSRPMPPVFGVQGGQVRLLRRGETPEDLVRFWAG